MDTRRHAGPAPHLIGYGRSGKISAWSCSWPLWSPPVWHPLHLDRQGQRDPRRPPWSGRRLECAPPRRCGDVRIASLWRTWTGM